MSDPIKIVVTAQTAEAAAALQKFVADTSNGLQQVVKDAHGSAAGFNQNRMAIMELGHSARSVMDGLAAGMSPLRLMMMEAPRVTQAMGEASADFRAKLLAFLPAMGGVAAAIVAGVVLWKYYGEALTDPTKRARDLADALEKIPDLLKKIEIAGRSGAINPDQMKKLQDMLGGQIPLYNVNTVADGKGGHANRIASNAWEAAFGSDTDKTGTVLIPPDLTTDPNVRNMRTGQVVGQRQPANRTDINDYVSWQMTHENATMANSDTNPGNAADVQLQQEELKMQRDAEIGDQKEVDRIKDRYELERRNIEELRKVEQDAGTWKDSKEKEYQQTLIASKASEARSIAEIQSAAAEKAAKESAEAQSKIREDNAKDVAAKIKVMEAQITDDENEEGRKRGENYLREYTERAALYTKLYLNGELSEDEYSEHLADAQKKAIEDQKEYNVELQKEADLRSNIARNLAENKLDAIRQNPMLTDEQKNDQSIAPLQSLLATNQQAISNNFNKAATATDDGERYEAENKITELMTQQVDLQNQLNAAAGQNSFTYQFSAMITKMQNEGGTIQMQMASIFGSATQGGINSISKSITGLIEGTQTWKKSLLEIEQQTIGQLLQGFIHMGVQWVTTHVLMRAASALFADAEKMFNGQSVSDSVMAATVKLGANAAVAGAGAASSEASIPYVGPILAAAAMATMVSDVMALGSMFSAGGYTGDGGVNEYAGIAHRGEFIFSAASVNRLGIENLDMLHRGDIRPADFFSGGGGGGGNSGGFSHKSVVVFDRQGLMNELKKPDYAHITIQHVMNNKAKIGIKT